MADLAWRSCLRLTPGVISSPGGPSAFHRWAWGDFSARKAPRSWRAKSNTSACRSQRSGLVLEYCGDVSPGNRVPKVILQMPRTVRPEDNLLMPLARARLVSFAQGLRKQRNRI